MANDAYPIDYDSIQKGDIIRQDRIEKIYQLKFDDNPEAYKLKAQLRLLGQIKVHRPDLCAHTKTKGRDIEILHDLPADDHTDKLITTAESAITNAARSRSSIDRTGFSEQELRRSDFRDRHGQALTLDIKRLQEARRRDELFFGAQKKTEELAAHEPKEDQP